MTLLPFHLMGRTPIMERRVAPNVLTIIWPFSFHRTDPYPNMGTGVESGNWKSGGKRNKYFN